MHCWGQADKQAVQPLHSFLSRVLKYIVQSFNAFSINLNKQFWVYLPSGFGTRILSILELCRLPDRLLASDEIVEDGRIDIPIDYVPVNAILNGEREKAHAFLDKALKD